MNSKFFARKYRAPAKADPNEGGGNGAFEPGDPAEAERLAAEAAAAKAKGGKTPTPTPGPTPTKVKIGGQEFEVDADLAAAIAAQQDEFEEQMQSARTPTPTPAPKGGKKAEDEEYDFAIGIFTEPDVAIQKLREQILTQVRGEYAQAEGQKTFWKGFYKANPDLKDAEVLVEAVMNKNWASLKDIPAEKAAEKLAKLSREAAAKLTKKSAGKGGEGGEEDDKGANGRQTLEGGSTPATKNSGQQQQPKVTSLSDIVRARQAAKRNGGKAAAS